MIKAHQLLRVTEKTSTLAQKLLKIRWEGAKEVVDQETRGGIRDLYYHANLHSHYPAPHVVDLTTVQSHRNETRCKIQKAARARILACPALEVGSLVLYDNRRLHQLLQHRVVDRIHPVCLRWK